MADIHEIQRQIIDEFKALSDWTERYKHIIKHGQNLDSLDEEHKIEENLVRGCQSQVWLHTRLEDGKVVFEADSDAAITKGLVALMVRFYSGQAPETIINTDPTFIQALTNCVENALNSPDRGFVEVTPLKKNLKMYPQERWEWGMTTTAEVWNGRLAMLGFIALLIELISGAGPLHFVGLL